MQQHEEALDQCKAREDEKCAKTVAKSFARNAKRYTGLKKNIDPRRLHDRKWIRFILHISELRKIGVGIGSGFRLSLIHI